MVPATFLPLQEPEIPRVLKMMAQLYAQDAIPWDERGSRTAVEQLLRTPEYGGIWMIQAGGREVGYVVLTIGFSLEFGGRFGLLDEFLVEEQWRSRGLGSQALTFVEEQCRLRGVRALRLEVDRKNTRAQALYGRCGFERHDRYMMTRHLAEA